MAVLHGITALVLAILLELLAGNAALVIPFTVCVLYRVTLRFRPEWVFAAGFFSGLFFDMLYWRAFPGTAIVYGVSLLAVRLICDRSRKKTPVISAAAAGLMLGVFSILPMAVLHRFYLGLPGISGVSALSGIIAALILELLIFPRSGIKKEVPERKTPEKAQRGKTPRRRSAAPKKNGPAR